MENSKTHATSANIHFVLRKKELKEEYWPRLLKESKRVHYLKTDFDKVCRCVMCELWLYEWSLRASKQCSCVLVPAAISGPRASLKFKHYDIAIATFPLRMLTFLTVGR